MGKYPQGARSKFERIAAVLEAPAPLWQTANQIKDNLLSQWNEDMKMSSISPALVAMRKDKHMLVRKNMTVALASRVKIEEPDTLFNENGEAVASPETGEPSRSPYDSPTLGWDDPA